MSAFESSIKKISAILGITTAGQKAKTGSLPVTLASDEDLISVVGAAGDAAVVTDTTGTASGKLRGLVKWAFERMPTSLGQKTAANSLGVVLASDAALVTGATDAAAAAGAIFPVAGLYDPAPTDLTSGQEGRLRMSARRALLLGADLSTLLLSKTVYVGDVQGSTTTAISGYGALTAAFLDGADAGFNASPRFLRIPLAGWKEITVGWVSTLNATLTVGLYAWPHAKGDDVEEQILLDTILANSGWYGADAVGGAGGATWRAVPALRAPMAYLVVRLTPGSDPSSGEVKLWIARR